MRVKCSPAGNRTRAFHVTGGDTHHYTTEEAIPTALTNNTYTIHMNTPHTCIGPTALTRHSSRRHTSKRNKHCFSTAPPLVPYSSQLNAASSLVTQVNTASLRPARNHQLVTWFNGNALTPQPTPNSPLPFRNHVGGRCKPVPNTRTWERFERDGDTDGDGDGDGDGECAGVPCKPLPQPIHVRVCACVCVCVCACVALSPWQWCPLQASYCGIAPLHPHHHGGLIEEQWHADLPVGGEQWYCESSVPPIHCSCSHLRVQKNCELPSEQVRERASERGSV